jgi:hypothetical protein
MPSSIVMIEIDEYLFRATINMYVRITKASSAMHA